MKQPGARSEDAALWDKRYRELYNEDERGNRNELVGKPTLESVLLAIQRLPSRLLW